MLCNDRFFQHIFKYLQLSEDSKVSSNYVINGEPGSGGVSTRIISLAKQCKSTRFGKNAEDEALIRQWMEYAVCYANYMDTTSVAQQVLKELNATLSSRAYFVGNTETLADAVLYTILYHVIVNMTQHDKEKHLHVSRWFDNIQQNSQLRQNNKLVPFCKTLLYT